jgi:hypothetical protein
MTTRSSHGTEEVGLVVIAALDGRAITVRRRWFPWRLRKRKFDNDVNPLQFVDVAEGPGSLVAGIVLGLVFFVCGGIILTVAVLASEALLLVALVIPLLALARMLWILPWIVEATNGDTVLGTVAVRGWRDSQDQIHDIADAYRRGEDPFEPKGYSVGT